MLFSFFPGATAAQQLLGYTAKRMHAQACGSEELEQIVPHMDVVRGTGVILLSMQ